MDANEYALQVQPATKSLGVVIRSAVWLGKGAVNPLTSEVVEADAVDSVEVLATKKENEEEISESESTADITRPETFNPLVAKSDRFLEVPNPLSRLVPVGHAYFLSNDLNTPLHTLAVA